MSDSRNAELISAISEIKAGQFVPFFKDSQKDHTGDLVMKATIADVGNLTGRAVKVNQDESMAPFFGITFNIEVLADSPTDPKNTTIPPVPGEKLAVLAKKPDGSLSISFREEGHSPKSVNFSRWFEVKKGETKNQVLTRVTNTKAVNQPLRFDEKSLKRMEFKLV